jgi:hypothetical protein
VSTNDEEIVVTIDAKRLIAMGLLAILTIATLSIYIIALLAWVAPDANYLTKVTELRMYEEATQTSTFSPGDTVTVKTTVKKATAYYHSIPSYTPISGTSAARTFIVVYYYDGSKYTLLHYYPTSTTLTPGVPFNVQTQFKLSSGAPTGAGYHTKCLVWSSNLPDGDTLSNWTNFNAEQEVTFSVS